MSLADMALSCQGMGPVGRGVTVALRLSYGDVMTISRGVTLERLYSD